MKGVFINLADPAQREGIKIQPAITGQALGRQLQGAAEFLQANDVLGHHAEDR